MIKDSIKDFYFLGLWEKYFRVGHLSMSHLSLKLIKVIWPSRFKWSLFNWYLLGLFHSVDWFSPFESKAQVTWLWSDACLICGFRALVQCVLWGLFLQSVESSELWGLLSTGRPSPASRRGGRQHTRYTRSLLAFASRVCCHSVQWAVGWTDAPLISESCLCMKLSLVTSQPHFTFEV